MMIDFAGTCLHETVDVGDPMTRIPICKSCLIFIHLLAEVRDETIAQERLIPWIRQNCIRGVKDD